MEDHRPGIFSGQSIKPILKFHKIKLPQRFGTELLHDRADEISIGGLGRCAPIPFHGRLPSVFYEPS